MEKSVNNLYFNYKGHGHQKDIFDVIDKLKKQRRTTITNSHSFIHT